MKKIIGALMCLVLVFGLLSGCGNKNTTTEDTGNKEKIKIVTTIFPIYDWVNKIIGDKADQFDVTMLLDTGVDLHSYQPTADDIIKISKSDMMLYVGGESDEWIEDALKEATNKDMKVINLLEVLGNKVKEEETVEGMEAEEHDHDHDGDSDHDHDEDHDHDGDSDHDHDEEGPEYDEHVWLSLKNAKELTAEIANRLAEINPENKDAFQENLAKYTEELDSLDKEYEATVSTGDKKTVLFGDRFPFRYLVDDYGLEYYAAFVGCSAETEASFDTITYLAKKIDELKLSTVLTIEGNNHGIADTIIKNTKNKNAKIRTMDSMQSVTKEDVNAGASYLDIMTENLNVLKEALK